MVLSALYFRFAQWRRFGLVGLVLLMLVNRTVAAPVEPATVEAAARLLDLRTFPVMDGATESGRRTLGMLMYDAKGDAKTAFDFQRKQFSQRGWKELKGGYQDATNASGQFTKDGYTVAVSTSGAVGEPEKKGWSHVTIINHGNISTSSLPVPKGVKPFYSLGGETSYLTESKVAETAAVCRELLLAAGWEPYGAAGADTDSPMLYFKRNAIQVMAWISTAPAQGNKTTIRYSTTLLSADLPVPPTAPDPRYNDTDNTLRYDWPDEDASPVFTFYQKRLLAMGWKPTTERPVVNDMGKTQFLIFRNALGDMISLDLERFSGIQRVKVQNWTAKEVAELDRLAKEAQERKRQEMAKKNIKTKLEVPLPARAAKIEQDNEARFEFTLATGGGPVAFRAFREHFGKADWTEEEGTRAEANTGSMQFKKGEATLRFSYFDTGLTDAEITVAGSLGLVLEPKPVVDTAPADDVPKTAKKRGLADLPGMPKLPPGVELPDMPEVGDLLKGLQAGEGNKANAAAKKKAGKQGVPASSGAVKVADIAIPPDATSLEYNKTTKMIKVASSLDVRGLGEFFVAKLAENGWTDSQKPTITDHSAILKFEKADASLTIFVHPHEDGSDSTIICKGVAWDIVPPSKIAAKKPTKKPKKDSDADSPVAKKSSVKAIVAPRISVAQQKQTGAMLFAGGKQFKLEYGVAYETKRGDETATEVLLSTKPIAIDKLVALLNNGQDGGDAASFETRLRLRYDAKGKLDYLFLYADGLSVNLGGPGEDVVKAEIALADGRARGKAVMVTPGKLFDNEYRFDATFDTALITGKPQTGDGDTPEPGTEELGAEEHDGLPYPLITTNRSSSGSRYRQSVTASVPASLTAMVDFYRRELTARGWKENADAAKITADNAQLAFAGPEGALTVQLSKQTSDVALNLAVRYPAKAKAAGVLPQPNRARLILGNGTNKEAVVVINGQPYKIAAGLGAKDPKDGTSLHLLPGKYTCVVKVPGKPDQTEELKVAVDETWGLIVLPTGGYFADQVY